MTFEFETKITKALPRKSLAVIFIFLALFSSVTGARSQQATDTGEDKVPLRGLTPEAPPAQVHPSIATPDADKLTSDKPPDKNEDLPLTTPLEEVRFRSVQSSGTIFVDPEKIAVKAPVLSALITLRLRQRRNLSGW